jgi:hypothetical protein
VQGQPATMLRTPAVSDAPFLNPQYFKVCQAIQSDAVALSRTSDDGSDRIVRPPRVITVNCFKND